MRADKLCYDSNGSFNVGQENCDSRALDATKETLAAMQWPDATKKEEKCIGRKLNPYSRPNSGFAEVLNPWRKDEYSICDRIVAEHDDIRYCPPVRHGGPGQDPPFTTSELNSWLNYDVTCNVEKICVSSYPKSGTLLKVTIE